MGKRLGFIIPIAITIGVGVVLTAINTQPREIRYIRQVRADFFDDYYRAHSRWPTDLDEVPNWAAAYANPMPDIVEIHRSMRPTLSISIATQTRLVGSITFHPPFAWNSTYPVDVELAPGEMDTHKSALLDGGRGRPTWRGHTRPLETSSSGSPTNTIRARSSGMEY